MTPLEALTEAYYLTAPYDLVSFASFSSISDMLVDLAGNTVSQQILDAAFKVLSNLSKMKLTAETEHRDLVLRVSDVTAQIIEANLASNPVV